MEKIVRENWKTFSEETLATSTELEEINKKIIDELTDNQINLAHSMLEANTKYFDGLSSSQEYPDIMSNHRELLNRYSETFFSAAKNTDSLLKKARFDYGQWFEESVRKSSNNSFFSKTKAYP